jgi:sec-independent protein translocase protein TatC
LSFQNQTLHLTMEARVSEYINLVIVFIAAFGFTFQMPILLVIMLHLGIIDLCTLMKNRKLAIVASFIIAAIITPPDVVSQLMLAIPMIIFYEVSIIIFRFSSR